MNIHERTHKNAAVCQDTTRKEEDGSSGACDLGNGAYCGNIFIWDIGHLLVAMLGIIHRWDKYSMRNYKAYCLYYICETTLHWQERLEEKNNTNTIRYLPLEGSSGSEHDMIQFQCARIVMPFSVWLLPCVLSALMKKLYCCFTNSMFGTAIHPSSAHPIRCLPLLYVFNQFNEKKLHTSELQETNHNLY